MTRTRLLVALAGLVAILATIGAGVTAGDAASITGPLGPSWPTADRPAEPTARGGILVLDLPVYPGDVPADQAPTAAAAPTSSSSPRPAPRTHADQLVAVDVVEDQADELVDVARPPVLSQPDPCTVDPRLCQPPTCATGEEWDGERCVAVQLPEEAIGGHRCADPAHVVVAIRADGTLVCGPEDDTVELEPAA